MKFKNGLMQIYKQTERSNTVFVLKLEGLAAVFMTAKFFRSVYMLRPVRSVFWGLLAVWFGRNLNLHCQALATLVHSISLHEDGQRVDI